MKKTGSRWIAWMAVFVLLGLTVRPDTAYGAGAIKTDEDCSITFDLSSNYQKQEGQKPEDSPYVTGDEYTDLQSLKIPVDIYKVADVDSTGKYKEPSENKDLYAVLKTELEKVSSKTTAAQWMTMAESAAGKATENSSLKKTSKELYVPDSSTTVTKLTPGLYLVMAKQVDAPDYTYTFDPYLVSLPGNSYNSSVADSTDEWDYEVTVGLKASREHRYGDLEIKKTLNSYNVTLGGATFIFQIEAVKENEKVYSDVVSINFDAPGSNSVKIEGKIPSGAKVTVTEVYTGASYEVESAKEQTETIIADKSVSVVFTNDYDNRLNSGTSIVNQFVAKGDGSLPAQGTGTSKDADTAPGEPGADTESGASQDTDNKQETQNIVWDVVQLYSNGQTGEEQQ